MQIAFFLYPAFTVLDAIGPYQVLSNLPGADVRFLSREGGPVTSDDGLVTILTDHSIRDVTEPDVLVVPGGFGTRRLLDDAEILDWIRSVHATSTWTTSVCTGSLLLAAAGLLDGVPATTHWQQYDLLASLGAVPTSERVVRQGKIVTAAGVSSGIDMGLVLAAAIAGDDVARAIQLGIEYDPQPPFDAGSPEKAGPEIVALVSAALDSAGAGDAL